MRALGLKKIESRWENLNLKKTYWSSLSSWKGPDKIRCSSDHYNKFDGVLSLPTSGTSFSTLVAVTRKLMASGMCDTLSGLMDTRRVASFLKVSQLRNLQKSTQVIYNFIIVLISLPRQTVSQIRLQIGYLQKYGLKQDRK